MSELAQGLKSKKQYIFYIVLFVMFVIEVYTLNRINKLEKDNSNTASSVSTVANSVNDLTDHIGINTLANGVVILDLQVDEIRMPKSKENIIISEVTMSGIRQWDVPLYKAYVGDVITWTWTTNENIISCDSNLDIIVDNPVLNSGNLEVNGQYSYTFDLAGTYYYTSQNSAGLSGVVVITDYPALTAGEIVRGPITIVPEGLVDNFDISVFQSSGCWKQCLNSKTNNANNKYSADGIDVLFTDCDGDWIFMAQTTSTSSSDIVIGAFGNKANILNSNQKSTASTYNDISNVFTVYDNGVYWYNYHFYNSQIDVNSLAASTADSLTFSWNHGLSAYSGDCTNTIGWAYNKHTNYWSQDFMRVCTSINSNGYEYISATAKTTQYLFTNVPTCTVIPESSNVIPEPSNSPTKKPSTQKTNDIDDDKYYYNN